ncbi:reverse transcriptase domain-containing protein [Tanacetum coccineum]
MDRVLPESPARVLPLVVQPSLVSRSSKLPHSPASTSSLIPERNPYQPPIPYPLSLTEALALMPKYDKMLKGLLSDKEKLLGLANTSLTKNCSAVLLKKLLEKLGDPRKFLIPCDFHEIEKCMALADLGASINLMPLSVRNKLMLPELIPTRMTLELANRSVAYLAGIAEDVCVQVDKFTFPADFIVVDYDVDPRVPLILRRPFLRKSRALVDVYEEELILRDGDEKLIFHADSTSKYPHKHGNESINMINFIDITCEDHFNEVLKIQKSFNPFSGSTTFPSNASPSLTSSKTRNEVDNFDPKADLREIKYLLNRDPLTDFSPKNDIDIIDPILERFTDEPALVYSFPPRDDDDDLFNFKSDNEEWKKLFDSTLPEESSEIATLLSSPFENEDKVFNPGILILGGTQIFHEESKDKNLKVSSLTEALLILVENSFLSHSSDRFFDRELLFFLESTIIETLLSFSSENEDKVFNPGILISKGVHSFTLGLSHRTYETFKIVNVHPNILNESPMKIFPFFCFCPKDKGIQGESS